MYVDTLWRDLGRRAGCLRYLPEIIVEHMHYLNNKSPEDEGYKRVNDPQVYADDEKAFLTIHGPGTGDSEFRRAVTAVKQLRGTP
jgi:hypothetical protein